MKSQHRHASHTDISKRLKRAHGHLAKVIAMIQEGQSCVDLAQQLHAVESAITNAKRELIHDHLEHCLADHTDTAHALDELKQLSKYL
ncbi:MAG: metal-sensing transcriptional repressor [Blastochloris viridis]|uniref:Metal-sensing transcriptional repressor n=1 Tax=Blastochloris viridis TaxID=1079 RepID=A0A6N4R292_BLAVI|nr:MAG: metal-sensing transcriptional repressor [Blastochloris viridis]